MGETICDCQICQKWHSESYAYTLARQYLHSPFNYVLTGAVMLLAGLVGLLVAASTGNEWWIMAAALPLVPFYAKYLRYRKEDARDRDTSLEMAAEREGWCTCIVCSIERDGALDGSGQRCDWSPNSGVDDIINNTAAGQRFRMTAARFASRAHA